MGRAIGIDLGTTNSAMAYVTDKGAVEIIPNAEGNRVTPSAVQFVDENTIIVGELAKHQGHDKNTILSAKRSMGTEKVFNVHGNEVTPVEISSMILKKLKEDAEKYLGEPVTDAVITVPAYFTDSQRTATRDAGVIAGLNVLSIINEPTSASLAYGIREDEEKTVIVYDLGGGTFDVSIVDISEGLFEVISTGGNNMLGGDDFDYQIVTYLTHQFKEKYGDIEMTVDFLAQLKEQAEIIKIRLSNEYVINTTVVLKDDTNTYKIQIEFTRDLYRQLIIDLVKETFTTVNQVLREANLTLSDIDEFLLVGGSTKAPIITEFVKELGIRPKLYNPDECVALGAAIQADILKGGTTNDVILLDVTPMDLGIEIDNGIFSPIITRNHQIPTRQIEIFTTQEDYQDFLDIEIYQGVMPLVRDNTKLGSFRLTGIHPDVAGKPQIEITFEIDYNGILKVTAFDILSGNEMGIEVQSLSLSEEELQEKIQQSERFAEANEEIMAEFKKSNEVSNEHMEEILKEQEERYKQLQKELIDITNKIEELGDVDTDEMNELKHKQYNLQAEVLSYQYRLGYGKDELI